ncbi:MAG TPA: GWxTD domain-containing protein [Thermoanaerobaculia bacterium]|nr:GWxTD domain-containing protein [Thermoanaerobaculia bacterium]
MSETTFRRRARIPGAGTAAVLALLLGAALAVPARAELSAEYRAWGAGPASHLFTAAEAEQWAAIDSDAEADQFVRLFWARRDEDPSTPDNEFRHEFERRVAFADQRFGREGVAGSMTLPGRVFIVLGPPSRMRTAGSQGSLTGGDVGGGDQAFGGGGSVTTGTGPGLFGTGGSTDRTGVASTETWFYEDERVPAVLKRKRFEVKFRSKPGTDEIDLWDSNEALATIAEVVESQVVSPDLTLSEVSAAVAETSQARAWRAQPVSDSGQLAALEAAVAAGGGGDVEAAAFRAGDGTWIVPVQVSTTEPVVDVPSPTLIGEVRDDAGERVLTFALAGTWQESKGQSFVKETLMLPPGSYRVTAGIADAAGQILWAGDESLSVPEESSEFWISDLVLGHDIHPMAEAQQMLEPFAWGGIEVVPRSGERFRASDELWLYLHACDVSLDAAGQPQLRVIAQLTGPKKFRGPLNVQPSSAGDRCWVVAQALDASAFEPGDYSMKLQVTDTGAGSTLNSERAFSIVP